MKAHTKDWTIGSRYGDRKTEVSGASRAVATVWTHRPRPARTADEKGVQFEQEPEGMANLHLIVAAPALLEFAEMIARMQTENESGGIASEDAIATVNDLIETARPLVAKARGAR